MRPALRLAVALLAALALLVPAVARAATPPPKQPTAVGTGGAAATVDQIGTRTAVDVLRRGGNAVDAAVAAAAALGVVEPYSCGVGGGGFMTVYTARDRRVHALDSRETAPAAMGPDSFKGLTTFEQQRVSGMSTGVPGTVRGWELALRRFGTWPLSRVLRPAIGVARRGFVVDQTFFDQTAAAASIFADFPATAALYLDPDGTARDVGSVIRNPDLARTYALLARRGPDALYRGEIARAIVDTVTHPPVRAGATHAPRPGVMTLDDLARYRALTRDPTRVRYRGLDVYGMSPPSSGGSTVGESLNILQQLAPQGLGALPRDQAFHLYLEATRRAYADRNKYIGDPDFVDVPLGGLLSRSFAAERAATVDPLHASASPVPPGDPTDNAPDPAPTDQVTAARAGSTTHLTVADRFGNVVSYTFTIEQTGGSGMVVPGYGFLLNNELTDFNLGPDGSSNPAEANSVAGGKRPRSSIAPTIALRGDRPAFAEGSPGGATIITTALQVLLGRVDFGLSLPQAIAAPRLSQRNIAKTEKETNVPPDPALIAALQARGHQFTDVAEIGAATGIAFLGRGRMEAAAEPVRRGGGSAMVVRGDGRRSGRRDAAARRHAHHAGGARRHADRAGRHAARPR